MYKGYAPMPSKRIDRQTIVFCSKAHGCQRKSDMPYASLISKAAHCGGDTSFVSKSKTDFP
ncbi:MAG: hypothetical protein ACLUFV_06240 [Acutalibacteraceae bacterium]